MKKIGFLSLTFSLFLIISCADDPAPQAPPPKAPAQAQPQPQPAVTETPPPQKAPVVVEQPVFDPQSVTKEEFDTAKSELQQLIQKLNGIIRAKNYDGWVSYLGTDYLRKINSKEYLERINRLDRMRKANITLYNAEDYFTHVVVPARTNDHVDDIEFISQNRVKAYTINPAGNRLRLYDLEKTRSGWKIIN
jgi:hypothetical protein